MLRSLRCTRPAQRSPLGLLALGTLIVASMLSAQPAAAQLTPQALGAPESGMVCLTGYLGAATGVVFKCSKTKVVALPLECRQQFPRYVVRAVGSPGTADGRDLCTRNAINLGSTDALGGLVAGTDYVKADLPNSTVTETVAVEEAAEEAALGLASKEVGAVAGATAIALNVNGSRDKANVTVRLYTFAIPTGNTISARR